MGDKVCDSMFKGKPKMDIEQKHCEAAFEGQLMAPGELDFNVNNHAKNARVDVANNGYIYWQAVLDLTFSDSPEIR